MNILIYTLYYPAPPHLRTQPDTLLIHYFAKELKREGHNVQVVFLSLHRLQDVFRNRFRDIVPTEADYVQEEIPVHLIRYQSVIPRRTFPGHLQAKQIDRMLKRFKEGLGWKPDRVFVHFPSAFTGITEVLADGVPVLGDFHNFDIHELERPYAGEAEAYFRRIPAWGARNRNIAKRLRELDGSHPLAIVYSGIGSSLIAPESFILEKAARQGEKLHVLYAGQLIPLKNVDILIRSMAELSFPCDLTIVGDGPERDRLEKLAAGSPDIVFKGRLSREETIRCMQDADVFMMLSRPETYGMVYLEALAQGCLTAAGRGEGFDGFIRDGENGFLGEPGSVQEAARILEEIHAMDAGSRREMVLAGYGLACGMTEERMAELFLSLNQT